MAEVKIKINLCATRGIILRIVAAVGVVMVTLAGLAVMAEVVAVLHFAPHLLVKFLSFRLSHIQATSIQTLVVLSVVQTFIFISLLTAAEFSLTTSARRGPSTLAPTIPLFSIISRPPKVALDF